MITVDTVRSRVRNSFETIVADLVDLVAIPSVSASSHDQSQVARSAEHVAGLLREIGLEARVLSAPGPDGAPRWRCPVTGTLYQETGTESDTTIREVTH